MSVVQRRPGTAEGVTTPVLDALTTLVLAAVDGATDARVESAAQRWSQRVATPAEVVTLVAQVRAMTVSSRRRDEVLERVTLAAVTAVSERQVRSALTDPLTGLATRARMDQEAQHLVAVSLREGRPLTAAVLDLDGLKSINDQQGHAAGDEAIAGVGRAIRQHVRKTDRAFRWGGDEFVLLMPSTTEQGARLVVERIQQAAGTPISAGVALHRGGSDAVDVVTWLSEADAALYRSRRDRAVSPPKRARAQAVRQLPRALVVSLAVAAAGAGGIGAASVAHTLGIEHHGVRVAAAAPTSSGSGAVTPDEPAARVTQGTPVRVAPVVVPAPLTVRPAVSGDEPRTTLPRVHRPVAPPVAAPVVPPSAPPVVVPPVPVSPPRTQGPVDALKGVVSSVVAVVGTLF